MTGLTLVEESAGGGREYELTDELTLGREACDLVIDDSRASRRHAAIRSSTEGVVIEDLGSRNGTFVNEERVEGPRRLSPEDRVRIGQSTWRVRGPMVAAETTFDSEPPTDLTGVRPSAPGPGAEAPPPSEAPSARPGWSGNVPPPGEPVPSAIRRRPAELTAPPVFSAPPARRGRGSAATRLDATVVTLFIVFLAWAGTILFLIVRGSA